MTRIASIVLVFTIVLHSTLGCNWHQAWECAECVVTATAADHGCPCSHGSGHEPAGSESSDPDCPSCAGDCQYVVGLQAGVEYSPESALNLIPAVVLADFAARSAADGQPVLRHAIEPHARLHLVHQILLI